MKLPSASEVRVRLTEKPTVIVMYKKGGGKEGRIANEKDNDRSCLWHGDRAG